jgi:hypothetical protein
MQCEGEEEGERRKEWTMLQSELALYLNVSSDCYKYLWHRLNLHFKKALHCQRSSIYLSLELSSPMLRTSEFIHISTEFSVSWMGNDSWNVVLGGKFEENLKKIEESCKEIQKNFRKTEEISRKFWGIFEETWGKIEETWGKLDENSKKLEENSNKFHFPPPQNLQFNSKSNQTSSLPDPIATTQHQNFIKFIQDSNEFQLLLKLIFPSKQLFHRILWNSIPQARKLRQHRTCISRRCFILCQLESHIILPNESSINRSLPGLVCATFARLLEMHHRRLSGNVALFQPETQLSL